MNRRRPEAQEAESIIPYRVDRLLMGCLQRGKESGDDADDGREEDGTDDEGRRIGSVDERRAEGFACCYLD